MEKYEIKKANKNDLEKIREMKERGEFVMLAESNPDEEIVLEGKDAKRFLDLIKNNKEKIDHE